MVFAAEQQVQKQKLSPGRRYYGESRRAYQVMIWLHLRNLNDKVVHVNMEHVIRFAPSEKGDTTLMDFVDGSRGIFNTSYSEVTRDLANELECERV